MFEIRRPIPWIGRVFAAALLFACATTTARAADIDAPAPSERAPGAHEAAVFDTYTPLAGSDELTRRLLRPLQARRLRARVAATGEVVSEQSIDLAQERFAYYVPRGIAPAAGYGLLVFVPPWPEAKLPSAWFSVLDRRGVILVTAAASGNQENVLARRIPLALSAYAAMARRFQLDSGRVYVGGFSGGSRVALRIALGYPDVFRGAVLNAGSDRFGTPDLSPPPADLQRRFEDGVRLVYATGTDDASHLTMDRHSRDSAHDQCIFNVVNLPLRHVGHVALGAAALDEALAALEAPRVPSPDIDACRAQRSRDIDRQTARVESLIASGEADTARRELEALDLRYAGLATSRSIELEARLDGAKPAAGR